MERITILLAVYNPPKAWFEKQLASINNQTYPDLELVIYDDCSSNVSIEEIEEMVRRIITRIPYRLERNVVNLGSTKTFERLTKDSNGDYFAYCDQDDIWEPDKLYKEWNLLKEPGVAMVCTNADAVDEKDHVIAKDYMSIPDSFKESIKAGSAWKALLARNYFWGCTLAVNAEIAKQSLPFPKNMYHDHYIEFYAATRGKIVFLDEPLVKYRLHGNNQTGFLKNIHCKNDYYNERIHPLVLRYLELLQKDLDEEQRQVIGAMYEWALCRDEYAKGHRKNITGMIRYRRFNTLTTVFEILTMPMPEFIWRYLIIILKKVKNLRIGKE